MHKHSKLADIATCSPASSADYAKPSFSPALLPSARPQTTIAYKASSGRAVSRHTPGTQHSMGSLGTQYAQPRPNLHCGGMQQTL
jgi:hypothetical protein